MSVGIEAARQGIDMGRLVWSEPRDKILPAILKAHSVIGAAVKRSINPHFSSRYADLTSVWEAIGPALDANDLTVMQVPGFTEGVVTLQSVIMHKSGESVSFVSGAPADKNNAQGVGSSITYLRRYALVSFFGVLVEEDDGNASVKQSKGPTQTQLANLATILASSDITKPEKKEIRTWMGSGGATERSAAKTIHHYDNLIAEREDAKAVKEELGE